MNIPLPLLSRLNALGDSTRCRLLLLLDTGEFSVSELSRILQASQPSVSRHLKVLAADGWVQARAEGTRRLYRQTDPLPEGAHELWSVVRARQESHPTAARDRERSQAVLARREDRAREFFRASAGRWDEVRSALFGARADLLPLFGLLDPGWTVADLGAGTGPLAAALAPLVAKVIGVDRSREMLEAARRRTRSLGNVEWYEAELTELPLPDGGVDLAVMSLVLHYVTDPRAVLAEARRILRPGGRLVIVDMRPHEREDYRERMGHRWPGFDAARLAGWLRRAGLEPAMPRPLPPDPDAGGPLLFVLITRRPGPHAPDPPSDHEPSWSPT